MKIIFYGWEELNSSLVSGSNKRRLIVLLTLSTLASLLLSCYGFYDLLHGNSTLGHIALVAALALLVNTSHALWRGNFETNVAMGTLIISVLFTLLYWRGFSENLHFI